MYNTWPIAITMNAAGYVADTACCVSPLLSALSAKSAERNIGHGTIAGRIFSANGGALSEEMATEAGMAATGEGRTPRQSRQRGMLLQLQQLQQARLEAGLLWLSPDSGRPTGFNPGGNGTDDAMAQGFSLKARGGDLAQ